MKSSCIFISLKLVLPLLILINFFSCHAMDKLIFGLTALSNFKTVGTPFALSDSAAKEIASSFPGQPSSQPHHYLEVGAGIGNITNRLVEKLGPNDTLDVVEILPENCTILDQKFGNNPKVTIYPADFLTWLPVNPKQTYDVVVSTVPHTTLGWDFTKSAFEKYEALTNGKLLFVQLACIHHLKCCDPQYQKVVAKFNRFTQEHNGSSKLVRWNLPVPVWIYKAQLSKGGSKKSS